MITLRFFISWIIAAVLMYLAFYSWHGIFLNEISKLGYPQSIFYIFAGITYIVISFLLFKIYELKYLKKIVKNIFLRGLIAGAALGGIVFVVTKVSGVAFSPGFSLKYLLFDGAWQVCEQTIGGLVMALGQFFIYDPVLEEEAIRIHQ
jgi:hypothetical protein